MDDARKRKFDAIVVWRFDRFARSTKHLLLALEEFRSLGIQFISYQENIDTSSALGQALFTIVSAVAQLSHALIASLLSLICCRPTSATTPKKMDKKIPAPAMILFGVNKIVNNRCMLAVNSDLTVIQASQPIS
jgi:hypothetical protein